MEKWNAETRPNIKEYSSISKFLSCLDSLYSEKIALKKADGMGASKTISPMMGEISIVLFLVYYGIAKGRNSISEEAVKWINELKVDQVVSDFRLSTGLYGWIWFSNYLNELGLVSGKELFKLELEACSYSNYQIDKGNYDYLGGGLGLVPAILKHSIIDSKRFEYLTKIVDGISKKSVLNNGNTHWIYQVEKLKHPDAVSFGLAHGMTGIISILSRIGMLGVEEDTCRRLVIQAVNFIISYKRKDFSSKFLFPSILFIKSKEELESKNGLGWCYGDLCVVICLLHAYSFLKQGYLKSEAIEIMQKVMNGHSQYQAVPNQDLSFCHGQIGIAHMLLRISNFLEDSRISEMAAFWFDSSSRLISSHNLTNTLMKESQLKLAHGLINGFSGIGLPFISAISSVKPDWDDLFLLNIE